MYRRTHTQKYTYNYIYTYSFFILCIESHAARMENKSCLSPAVRVPSQTNAFQTSSELSASKAKALVDGLWKATLLQLSCLPLYINIQSHLTICKIHKHSRNKNNGTLKTCTTTFVIRADRNWCYRLYNWTYWDRSKVVPSVKRIRFSEYAHIASHGRLVYRKSQQWSRDSAVKSFRLTDWPTTQQDLQLPWLSTTCREAKSFWNKCTTKRFGVNTFIWAFLLKNVNQKYFTRSPVQDSILFCKCKTQVYASGRGEEREESKSPHTTAHVIAGVLRPGGGADGKFILQLYKAEVKSETGTIITVVGECKKVDRERAYV